MASMVSSFSFLFFLVCHLKLTVQSPPLVPAIYVFGDSWVDVGNNNYLNILSRADFPLNGIDFEFPQNGVGFKFLKTNYTGRFSNGKVIPDFLADEVGLPFQPPHLSLVDENGTITNPAPFMTGVNFASGGSGILDHKYPSYVQVQDNLEMVELQKDRPMPMSQQIELYSSVYEYLVQELGFEAAQAHLSKSLFFISVGINDINSYFDEPDLHNTTTLQQYVELLASTFKSQLKVLYKHGARKYVVNGVGLLGCTPARRTSSGTGECKHEMNSCAKKYNIAIKLLLHRMTMELPGFAYSYADIYGITSDVMQTPSSYGFTEIKAACCGLGQPFNAIIPCIPIASLCPNRNDHLFWDPFHPTEKFSRIIVDYIFHGGHYTYPINIKELIAKRTKNIGYQYY